MSGEPVDLRVAIARRNLRALAHAHPELCADGPVSAEDWLEELEEVNRMVEGALTLAQAAQVVGVSAMTLRRAIKAGELRAAQLSTHYRVTRAELDRWWRSKGGSPLWETPGESEGTP